MELKEPEMRDVVDAGKKVDNILEKQVGDIIDAKQKVGETSNRWKEVRTKLVEKRNKEDSKLRHFVQYVASVEELGKWIQVTSSSITTAGPDSNEPEVLNRQLDHTKVCEILIRLLESIVSLL